MTRPAGTVMTLRGRCNKILLKIVINFDKSPQRTGIKVRQLEPLDIRHRDLRTSQSETKNLRLFV